MNVFAPILRLVTATMPRDNLLNSACLELFEFLRKENVRTLITGLVRDYRPILENISYVDTFHLLIRRYDIWMNQALGGIEGGVFGSEDDSGKGSEIGGSHARANGAPGHGTGWSGLRGWSGVRDLEAEQEEYFNTSDDEDELLSSTPSSVRPSTSGVATHGGIIRSALGSSKPLVDYPEDDDDDDVDVDEEAVDMKARPPPSTPSTPPTSSSRDGRSPSPLSSHQLPPITGDGVLPSQPLPLEKIKEKRRREEDDEDELGKLTLTKRRSSMNMGKGFGGHILGGKDRESEGGPTNTLRRKKSFLGGKEVGGLASGKKIAITLGLGGKGKAKEKEKETEKEKVKEASGR